MAPGGMASGTRVADNRGVAQPEWSNQAVEADMNAWVARFAPLVMPGDPPSVPELKQRLKEVDDLRMTGQILQDAPRDALDPELVDTFHQATSQLDSIEAELRKRLGRMAPGDPAGIADLDALQDRLAEREARQELGVLGEQDLNAPLDMKLSEGSWASAIGLGTFGFAWTSFTTVHCLLMVGGMTKAIGWAALGLLGFYSIFFLVGFAMLAGAFLALCREEISLDGLTLTVNRCWKRIKWKKTYTLMPDTKARIGAAATMRNSDSPPSQGIIFTDSRGKEVTVGTSMAVAVREKALAKINDYLAAQPNVESELS